MKIALLGNPNTGKSSVFNLITGLRQQVGNFPGVTVEKKTGTLQIDSDAHTLIDFPGTYSLYPRSKDEHVVYSVLSDENSEDYPDVVVVVVDQSNLERNLFLFSQIYDLGLPTILVLNMSDLAQRNGLSVDSEKLNTFFPAARIVTTNARVGMGKERLMTAISDMSKITPEKRTPIPLCQVDDITCQEQEASSRYTFISEVISTSMSKVEAEKKAVVSALDRFFVHPIFGYLIFAAILFVVFQFIFAFAAIPMDLIDTSFAEFGEWLSNALPKGVFSDLVCKGIIPGIGGVLVFVPQIALLFFFISILEETGYLSRVVFIMDRLMRPLGLNGKSVVPLMSSVACAIPGVMATRTISDWKERMITILVAPLMSCSARIPVYTLLIALVIPKTTILGVFNLQGLVLFGLYTLGLVAALLVAVILKFILKSRDRGFLMLELPTFKSPRWGNVGITVWEKVKVFMLDAGKIILAISILLWALATYGPSESMKKNIALAKKEAKEFHLTEAETNQRVASAKMESSYIGHLGHFIEPAIKPLGYDWKIGISLITSFAAREVFVGSLSTIYSVNETEDVNKRLIDKMRAEKRADGTQVYTLAAGASLMVFYVFAMQCMATLAVVKRETNSWKWPLIQIGFMGALAYFGALITFNLLS
ncbi:MAG: ferrous iron transport protein [Bacteroidota bacterium]|jgi:ferrous iron transport protein B